MGMFFGKLWTKIIGSKDTRILLVGLDAVGKTTILYKIKMAETVKTIPTIGFNVESMTYKGLKMTMWDIGGQDDIRKLWKHYYDNTDAIIYVVDSCDEERIGLAQEELFTMLNEPELEKAHLLVFANKQDMRGALTPNQIVDKMELQKLKNRKWHVQGSSAVSGQGLQEGLDYLAKVLNA